MQWLSRIKVGVGEFWWNSLLIFVFLRLVDLLNAFTGLVVVPHYVKPEELGAILPLIQIGAILSLPVAILLTIFGKFLNTYATHDEWGKVKAILRDACFLVVIGGPLIALLGLLFLPFCFERLRVVNGLLGVLIIGSSIIGTLVPIFVTALQSLKRFNAYIAANVLGSVARLLSMVIFMPIRALSGYVISQQAPNVVSGLIAFWHLRKRLFTRTIICQPYLRHDLPAMIRYGIPVGLNTTIGTLCGGIFLLIIRHRLSDMDSAAYYMLTRFSDIIQYGVGAMSVVLFPFAAEAHERGTSGNKLLRHSLIGALLCGLVITGVLGVTGHWILELFPSTRPYADFFPYFWPIGISTTLIAILNLYSIYQTACKNFRFLLFILPINLASNGLLYLLAGITFFEGILPATFIQWVLDLNVCALNFIIYWQLASNALMLLSLPLAERFRR